MNDTEQRKAAKAFAEAWRGCSGCTRNWQDNNGKKNKHHWLVKP